MHVRAHRRAALAGPDSRDAMTKAEDLSYRARSVARFIDRLQPGDYVIHLTLPPRHYAEPYEIKAEPANLTQKNVRAIKPK